MRVNKWKDFAEAVGWTAIQAAAGAVITVLAMDLGWEEALSFVGIATLVAACKVIVAQQYGDRSSGDAIPGGVVET